MKIEEISLNKENLLRIAKIDNTFYTNAITGINWYTERYNENHKGIVLTDNDNIVGYIVAVPIKKPLYDAIINGVIINDININPKMFVNKSNYKYIVSCVILEKYRNQGYATKMMKKLFAEGHGKYCALTISQDGYNLASKFMKLKSNICQGIDVFVKEIN